ncbi:hypothetical protein BH11MYX1_BH11MYX1_00940 [soil metagenome]
MHVRDEILFVGNFLSASGTHRHYCEDLSDRLELRDWQVLRTSHKPGRVARLVDMMSAAWRHRHAYRLAHLDVFSGPAFFWAEAVTFELRRLGKPVVLTLRGGRLPEFAQRWPKRVARLLSSAETVVAPSTFLRDAFPDRKQIVVIPNAIELASYQSAVRSVIHRLVWVRAFHAIYNPTLAIEVLARLVRSHPDLTLVMIGADKLDGSLQATRARARELGVEPALTIIPGVPKSQVPAHLAGGDVFLNTANIDNTPISVIEAMATGLCVVSTNVGGMPHLVRDGHDALLVPPRDPGAMSAAVSRLLGDAELATTLSRNARRHAEELDWSSIVARWEQLFRQVPDAA